MKLCDSKTVLLLLFALCSLLFALCSLLFALPSNGLRYLRVGGRGFCLGAGKTRSQKNARKCRRIPSVGCTTKERGSFFTRETIQQFYKVYSQRTGQKAVQSNGGTQMAQPRGAPWLPVKLIYTLAASIDRMIEITAKTPMRKLIP